MTSKQLPIIFIIIWMKLFEAFISYMKVDKNDIRSRMYDKKRVYFYLLLRCFHWVEVEKFELCYRSNLIFFHKKGKILIFFFFTVGRWMGNKFTRGRSTPGKSKSPEGVFLCMSREMFLHNLILQFVTSY